MPRYSEAVIEQIKSRLTASEVVSSYVKLTKKGERWWGLCPFHHEKTPSFTVVDDGGFFKCFGCGKGGSIFDFVMEQEHVDFPQAVEILARRAGVELKQESEEERREYSKQKALQDLYNRIANSFHQILLKMPYAQGARDYIEHRKITPQTVELFMLGYAPDNPEWLYGFLKNNGYSDEILKESGLFSKNYEKLPLFRNRVLFPIRNWQGNCVAFGGRDLSGDSRAKYINTPETVLYSKRNTLFGFWESLPELKKRGEIILCEGNFDVVSLHQAGIRYAAAPLGTAFTEEQAKLIKRYCTKVSVLFDSDAAGQNAAVKALLICQKYDIENRVIKLEGVKDASQMLEEQGPKALFEACGNAVQGFSYLVHSALKMYDIRQPKGKTSVFKEVRPYLDATSSEIERQGYIKYLSDVLGISEEQILTDYRKRRTEKEDTEEKDVLKVQKYNPLKVSADLNALLLLINNRSEFDYFRHQVRIDHLEDRAAQQLYGVLENAVREEVKTNDLILQMIPEQELKELVVLSFASGMYKPENTKKSVRDAVYSIKLRRLEEKRKRILGLISSGEMNSFDRETFRELLEEKDSLDNEIEELKKEDTEDIYS